MTLEQWPTTNFKHTIYLEIIDGASFRIPVNPEVLPEGVQGGWIRREIINLGEVAYPTYPKSVSLKWDSFFPAHFDPDLCAVPESELLTPLEYVNLLRAATLSNKVLHIICASTQVNDFYTIEKFDTEMRGGEFDIYYTLELKSYRTSSIKKYSGDIVPTYPGVPSNVSNPGAPRVPGSNEGSGTSGVNDPTGRPDPVTGQTVQYAVGPSQCTTLRTIADTTHIDVERIYEANKDTLHLKLRTSNGTRNGEWIFSGCTGMFQEDTLDVRDWPLNPNTIILLPISR